MGFIIVLFTLAMVLDCVVLIGLVLIQLPKKDTGGGLAFGGGASDALFGAGSGNVLTKITKYAATLFFILAVILSVMQRIYHTRGTSGFGAKIGQLGPPAVQSPPATAPNIPSTPLSSSNESITLPIPTAELTNLTSSNSAPSPMTAPK
jgi:preprotein translocase subunit SecG